MPQATRIESAHVFLSLRRWFRDPGLITVPSADNLHRFVRSETLHRVVASL